MLPPFFVSLEAISCMDLTHCILVDSSTVICWMCLVIILGVSGLFCHLYSISFGKSCQQQCIGPSQTPHYVASDLGLHCLPMALLRVSR